MVINLRCFAGLSKDYPCDFKDDTKVELPEGAIVNDLFIYTGVPEKKVKTVFLNGRIATPDRNLSDGDRVALMPATGGM